MASTMYGLTATTTCVGEAERPWVDSGGGTWTQLLRVSSSSGEWLIRNRFEPGYRAPTHRHTGQVHAFTQAGHWRYEEYDFVAQPGSMSTSRRASSTPWSSPRTTTVSSRSCSWSRAATSTSARTASTSASPTAAPSSSTTWSAARSRGSGGPRAFSSRSHRAGGKRAGTGVVDPTPPGRGSCSSLSERRERPSPSDSFSYPTKPLWTRARWDLCSGL